MLTSELRPTDRLVMDTHIWVWVSGEAGGRTMVNPSILQKVESAAQTRHLFASAASVWELALKARDGQALFSGDLHEWVQVQTRYPGVRILSVGARVSIESCRLPDWVRIRDGKPHKDPADRFIVTTARMKNAVLITCDREILAFAANGHLRAFDARP